LSLDPLKGRGKLIGGDLDVDEKGSVGYQFIHTQIDLVKKAKSMKAQSRTQARTRKNITKLQMNDSLMNVRSYKPMNGEIVSNKLI
jgi:hypothetical protein